jgi:uncharacterized membrane protein YkoI
VLSYGYGNYYYHSLWDNYWNCYRINSEAAIQIALQQVPGQVIKVELEHENGLLVYEIYIRNTYGLYEVTIDATTGKVLKIEREND